MGLTKDDVLRVLSKVMDPELNMSLTELQMVKDVEIQEGSEGQGAIVSITIALTTESCPLTDTITEDVEKALKEMGAASVEVKTTVMTKEELDEVTKIVRKRYGNGSTYSTVSNVPAYGHGDILKIIAVGSGKGGVGKSLVAAMLAIELRRAGFEVGVLDADITGPSIAEALGLAKEPPMAVDNKILPFTTANGIKAISMNLFLDNPEGAIIWRGPLVTKAIQQFYSDVAWGKLHYLVIDLPPGTSDAAITVFQSIPVDGVVVVTSPQHVANMVVSKFINMAKEVKVPVLGLVENMAFVKCPCGDVIYPFGQPKGEEEAKRHGVPFLGRIPIDPDMAEMMDEGVLEAYHSEEFKEVARNVRLQAQLIKPRANIRPDWQLRLDKAGVESETESEETDPGRTGTTTPRSS
ncbi:MAG: P-loop NTPase [Candidatus Marsarchaeota archaeon]